MHVQDRINLIYTDTPYAFEANFGIISTYAEKLRVAAFAALEEDRLTARPNRKEREGFAKVREGVNLK